MQNGRKEKVQVTGSKSWGHFYADSGSQKYYDDHVAIHREFLDEALAQKPRRLLEAGCGSGIMSVYFSKQRIACTAVDRDAEVLAKARESAAKLGGGAVKFMQGDIFRLGFSDGAFDAVFSQGVLEHFDDEMIRKAAKESLRVAPRAWVSVPSGFYNHKDFGDERLLSENEWKKILEPVARVRAKPYFFKRVKRNFLIKRPLMLLLELTRP
jgi:ubiquinone/menaquinone biosynthesis C-methylase UbiE